MNDCKHVSTPVPFKAKFTKTMNPITPIEQLGMQDVPYATIVSKLMYLVTNIQLDLAYVVSHCIQFMTIPLGYYQTNPPLLETFKYLGNFLLCKHQARIPSKLDKC
jgi:hypothetical protein